jgi:hypothetical protein
MSELKIKTHTTYTYETSDGREFDDADEAQEWQQALEDIKSITMLDDKFNPTTETASAFYVHIKNHSQLKAFELMQTYEGFATHIPDRGCWYYDDVADDFVNIEKEINRLKDIQYKLYDTKKEE